MNTTDSKPDFLLLFRGTDWDKGLSPKEIQQIMGKLTVWMDRLHREGRVKAGHPLGNEGRTISGRNGRMVADGPFAESKEAIGGFLIIEADDLDAAVALARQFPCLEQGASVEVRPIAGVCPTFQRVQQQLAVAEA